MCNPVTVGSFVSKKKIIIKLDNMASASVINTGNKEDTILALIAKNIWLLRASQDIEIVAIHVTGVDRPSFCPVANCY